MNKAVRGNSIYVLLPKEDQGRERHFSPGLGSSRTPPHQSLTRNSLCLLFDCNGHNYWSIITLLVQHSEHSGEERNPFLKSLDASLRIAESSLQLQRLRERM